MSKAGFAAAAGCARRRAGRRACHAGNQAGDGRVVLQGGVCRAAWLRRIADRQDSRPDSGRRDRRQSRCPKPGWNLETVKGKYAIEYENHGSKVSEGVKEVVWSGGKLADDNYDEFIVATYLTGGLKPNTTLYFPVVQECEQGVSRWIDIPKEGQGGGGRRA